MKNLNLDGNSKWRDIPNRRRTELKKYNIEIEGKKILALSGGPGHFAISWKNIASKVVVTEFREISVKGMKKNLGIVVESFLYLFLNQDYYKVNINEWYY